MVTITSPIGIPLARPKSFGMPSGLETLPAIYRITQAAGGSTAATVGRIALLFDWMAHWQPEGQAPTAHMIQELVSRGESAHWRRKHAPAFAKAFLEEACNEDGECWLFTHANGAAHRTRVRQREQMRKRRGVE